MSTLPLIDEIAACAACLIAEEGLDYVEDKKKALKQMGLTKKHVGLPDNDLIEQYLREYQAQYQSDTQPQELLRLRRLALVWMERLAAYHPHITGAVWNGTGSAHSAVHLILLTDDEKMQFIYIAGVSTRESVSEMAGRGMGMSIVEKNARRIAATVTTESKKGAFTRFTIIIPRENVA